MSKKSIKNLLLIEDNSSDAHLLREMLNEPGSAAIEVTQVDRVSEAERYLAGHAVDIILLDLGLPDAQGLGAVRRAHAAASRVPLVVLTGGGAPGLRPLVQSSCVGVPDLVLRGLAVLSQAPQPLRRR